MEQNGKQQKMGQNAARVALFVVFLAVCGWITVPFSVPFTMQTFGVVLALSVLGGAKGTLAIGCYLLLGLAGAPVFSGFRGGVGVLLGATGGYLLGFLLFGLVFWLLTALFSQKSWAKVVAVVLGHFLCYLFGTLWFCLVFGGDGAKTATFWGAFSLCVLPYILPDALKGALALWAGDRISQRLLPKE